MPCGAAHAVRTALAQHACMTVLGKYVAQVLVWEHDGRDERDED